VRVRRDPHSDDETVTRLTEAERLFIGLSSLDHTVSITGHSYISLNAFLDDKINEKL